MWRGRRRDRPWPLSLSEESALARRLAAARRLAPYAVLRSHHCWHRPLEDALDEIVLERARPSLMKKLLLLFSHILALAVGFALGVYFLPVLTAPAAPSSAELAAQSSQATYKGQFRRDLKDSDALHWG